MTQTETKGYPTIKNIEEKLRPDMLPGELFLGNYESAEKVAQRNSDSDDIGAPWGGIWQTPDEIREGYIQTGNWETIRIIENTFDIYGNSLPHSVALVGIQAKK